MAQVKIKFCCCALWSLLASGCGLFDPQAPERFGDVQINVRFAEMEGKASGSTAEDLFKLEGPAQAIDRFVVIISEYGEFEQLVREVARREIFVDRSGQARAVVRVPLQPRTFNYFSVEVQAFERLHLLYTGQGFVQFEEDKTSATVEIFLQPVAFFASFASQPSSPRFVLGQASVLDSMATAFDFEGNGVIVTVPVGRASQVSNAILLWGDTTLVKIRAWQNDAFRGEVTNRISYGGLPADLLIACTWNQPVNFNLEIVNPLQQTISEISPGDVPEGSGAMQLTDTAYGPEVFEWRAGRITQGTFQINISRPDANTLGNGTVYVIRREGQPQQSSLQTFPFEFRPIDPQNSKLVTSFTWP